MNAIKAIWIGNKPLYLAYWGVGIIGVSIVASYILFLLPQIVKSGLIGSGFVYASTFAIYLPIHTLWFWGVIKCSKNTEHQEYGRFAKYSVYFSAVFFIFMLQAFVSRFLN
jgi:hypothetical protein